MYYTLFVDESGDEGVANVRSVSNPRGADPWFFLGAYVVADEHIAGLRSKVEECKVRTRSNLHCSQITHEKKVFFCKEISALPITCFALISDKSGLTRGNYIAQVTPENFYNKNVKYLFENIGLFCEQNNIHIQSVVFEKKANKNYTRLSNYLCTVRANPIYPQSHKLIHIDVQNVGAKTKAEEALLTVADALAYSIAKSCCPNQYGFTEYRYLKEMESVFYSDVNGIIAGNGIKAVPSFNDLRIGMENITFLKSLRQFDEQPQNQNVSEF